MFGGPVAGLEHTGGECRLPGKKSATGVPPGLAGSSTTSSLWANPRLGEHDAHPPPQRLRVQELARGAGRARENRPIDPVRQPVPAAHAGLPMVCSLRCRGRRRIVRPPRPDGRPAGRTAFSPLPKDGSEPRSSLRSIPRNGPAAHSSSPVLGDRHEAGPPSLIATVARIALHRSRPSVPARYSGQSCLRGSRIRVTGMSWPPGVRRERSRVMRGGSAPGFLTSHWRSRSLRRDTAR